MVVVHVISTVGTDGVGAGAALSRDRVTDRFFSNRQVVQTGTSGGWHWGRQLRGAGGGPVWLGGFRGKDFGSSGQRDCRPHMT